MKEIHLWARLDGPPSDALERAKRRARRPGKGKRAAEPSPCWPAKVLQAGDVPPGPGAVYAVMARSADEARSKLRRWIKLDSERQALQGEEARALLARKEPLLNEVRLVTSGERS